MAHLPERLEKTFFVPMTREQLVHHRENEEIVDAFLREEREFTLEQPARLPDSIVPAPSGCVTLMPSMLDSDGYFLAWMRRA